MGTTAYSVCLLTENYSFGATAVTTEIRITCRASYLHSENESYFNRFVFSLIFRSFFDALKLVVLLFIYTPRLMILHFSSTFNGSYVFLNTIGCNFLLAPLTCL